MNMNWRGGGGIGKIFKSKRTLLQTTCHDSSRRCNKINKIYSSLSHYSETFYFLDIPLYACSSLYYYYYYNNL